MSKQTEVYIWGNNEKAQLSRSVEARFCSPRYFLSSIQIQSVCLSSTSSIFLSESGEVYKSICPVLEQIPELKPFKVVSISSGYDHFACITSTGNVYT